MTITLDLKPEIENVLLVQAAARGVSLTEFAQEVLAREAHASPASAPSRTGQSLVDVCAKVRGLLTNEEVDTLFSRNQSSARPVNFE